MVSEVLVCDVMVDVWRDLVAEFGTSECL